MKYDRVLAIDLGNGLIKVRSTMGRGMKYTLSQPSVFSYAKDVGEAVSSKILDLDSFKVGDMEYVWGNDITKVAETKSTYGHENRYKTEAFKIMARIVMAKAVNELEIQPHEKILVVTGVPSAETGTERENDIREAFMGDNNGIHEVEVNGFTKMFKVAHVEVMPQALSTVIGRYLDEHGGVEDEDYETMRVAVIDIGGGTVDLDIVHALRRQNGYHSVPKGFRDVYDNIRKHIVKIYPSSTVTDYELLKVLESSNGRYEYKPSRRMAPVDITEALNDGVEELALDTQQAIMSRWKNQTDLDEILLVGGSADLFKEPLSHIVDGITVPPNNGDSNVEGYYRFGVYLSEGGE